MKYVVAGRKSSLSEQTAALSLPSLLSNRLSITGMVAAGLLSAGMISNVDAASQGRLGSESSASIGITLTIPDNLHVQSSASSDSNQVSAQTKQSSGLGQMLCVQGVGIDHYSLSVSGSTGALVISNGKNNDIPYQVTWNDEGDKVLIPADDGNKLVVKTDSSCDDPSSVKIKMSDDHALDNGDYDGAAILNIGVE